MMKKPEHIMIVGGGTAGWLAALMLSHAWKSEKIKISLIESPDVGIIGVGEGSTPALAQLFKKLAIPEEEWMPQCSATYKCGIEFIGWSGRAKYPSYFHPFASSLDKHSLPIFVYAAHAQMAGVDIHIKPDDFFLSAQLAKKCLAPKPLTENAASLLYGYHFDAGLLGKYLSKKAMSMGVVHRQLHITEVINNDQGEISSLKTDRGELLNADFFIDCTGFQSLLMQKHLKEKFCSYQSQLLNNAAVTLPTETTEKLPSQTTATALKNGWAWQIPLIHRVGNGYVYSNNFCSADEAEYELRAHLGLLDSAVNARHLTMRVGRLQHAWQKNCLAVGLSQGFIEPLEATALYLVQVMLDLFIEAVTKGNFSNDYQTLFNSEINAYFDGVRDYIVTHYKTSARCDTEYWRANTASDAELSEPMKQLYSAWLKGENLAQVISQLAIERYYPTPSWYCIFTGMGLWGNAAGQRAAPRQLLADFKNLGDFLSVAAQEYPDHKMFLTNRLA